jgi:thioredoxin reductase
MIAFDAVVVGGGPAGLSAAIAAARNGLRTALFDENPVAGGALRYRLDLVSLSNGGTLAGPAAARALVDEALRQRVQIATGAVAWGAFNGFIVGVTGLDAHQEIRAERLILATGSTDLAAAFPGSDLPGVLTGSALLRLLHIHRVWPGGRRVVVAGTGDLAEECAVAVRYAGGEVVARGSLDALATSGNGAVERVTVDGVDYPADVIAICAGRRPDFSLALALEAQAGYSKSLGGFTVMRSESLVTSVAGLYVCGSAGGIGSIASSLAEGTLAGLAAAASLGKVSESTLRQEIGAFAGAFPDRVQQIDAIDPEWTQHFVESVIAGAGE